MTPEQENVRLRELLLTIQGCLWQSISVEPDPVGMKLLYDEIRHELGGSAISGIAKHRILMPSTLLLLMRLRPANPMTPLIRSSVRSCERLRATLIRTMCWSA